MSKYDLLLNATATQAAAKPQGQAVTPAGPTNPNMPPQQQTFQIDVSGVGAISASAQIVVSNDVGDDPSLYRWSKYGDPIATNAGNDNVTGMASMNGSWRSFGAYLTAISGTGAKANVLMNA